MYCPKCISVILFLELISTVIAGNILVLNFLPAASFIKILDGILTTLASKHKITVYSVFEAQFAQPNISVIKVNVKPIKSIFNDNLYDRVCNSDQYNVFDETLAGETEESIENVYNEENVKKLLETNIKYDLLIVPANCVNYILPFAHFFKIPLVQIAPTYFLTLNNEATGNPMFITTANSFCNEPYSGFICRIKIYMYNIKREIKYRMYYWNTLNTALKYFPLGTPTIEELNLNTSLMLVNTNAALGYVGPTMPHIVEVGGIFCRPSKPLPSDLEDFISGSGEHGIIYISFGSSIRAAFPEHIKTLMINVFKKLPQRVLWKWNEDIDNLPPNVRSSKWFSQQDILGHNKTKLFVTQTGILSLQETVYHGVPVITIPIALDQPLNAKLAQQLGYGEIVEFCKITEELLLKTIQDVISNSKYKENVDRISNLMKQELIDVDKRLLKAVDYVLQHNGNPIIQQLPYRYKGFQGLDVDIVVFLVLSCLVILSFIFYIVYKVSLLITFLTKQNMNTKSKVE